MGLAVALLRKALDTVIITQRMNIFSLFLFGEGGH